MRDLGYRRSEEALLRNLGLIAVCQKQFAAAQSYYDQSLAIARDIGNSLEIGATLEHLGYLMKQQKKSQEAIAYYEQALDIWRRLSLSKRIDETMTCLETLKTNSSQFTFGRYRISFPSRNNPAT